MPTSGERGGTFLGKLLRLVGRRSAAERASASGDVRARWPHLAPRWLDPDAPLAGWKATLDRSDVEDALRILAAESEGRIGDAEVAEVLDVLAHTEEDIARAFRFGRAGTFGQIWVGLVGGRALSVKAFVLASHDLLAAFEASLSVARFAPAAKRTEYEELRRFFLAAWSWQWTASPFAAELRASKPPDFDPMRTGESMERVLTDPGTSLLELVRGLRRRTRDLLEETSDLAEAELAAADAYLGGRGAPTLSEMRRRYLAPPATAPA